MGFEQTSIKIEQPKLATWTHSFPIFHPSDGALDVNQPEVHKKIRYPPHIGFGSEEEIWGESRGKAGRQAQESLRCGRDS